MRNLTKTAKKTQTSQSNSKQILCVLEWVTRTLRTERRILSQAYFSPSQPLFKCNLTAGKPVKSDAKSEIPLQKRSVTALTTQGLLSQPSTLTVKGVCSQNKNQHKSSFLCHVHRVAQSNDIELNTREQPLQLVGDSYCFLSWFVVVQVSCKHIKGPDKEIQATALLWPPTYWRFQR